MITTFKDATAKALVALVAAAMVFSLFVPSTRAQSTEDLQQMINDLLAQIAALQSQVGQGGSSVASGVCPFTWTRDLSQGSTGADVMKLQQFLNADADTRVAASGPGSVGMETEYFGPMTAAAVSKMQVKYRAEILSPAGLVNPTGFFGPSSRAKANALCAAPAPVDPAPVDPVDDEDDVDAPTTPTAPAALEGEASLDVFEIRDADDTLIREGATSAVIGEVTVEFINGDAEISRMDFILEADSLATERRPWEAFRNIQLWVDGDMVAEKRIDRRSDFLNDRDGSLRFTGLNLVAREDERMEILVAVDVAGTVRGANVANNAQWTLTLDSMRFFDADGVAETLDVIGSADTANFVIEEAGADEEIRISLASNNPRSTTILVDETRTTTGVNVFNFDIEGRDGDIELDRVVVRVDTPGSQTDTEVVSRARLILDGRTYTARTVGGTGLSGNRSQAITNADDASITTGEAVWYLFDIDRRAVVGDRERMTARLELDFRGTDNYSTGQRVQARVTSVERGVWRAEGVNIFTGADFAGTATGDEHTLVSKGIVVPVDGFNQSFNTVGQNDTTGIFTLDFDVTAVDGDFYILGNATSGAATSGVLYTATPAGSATATVSATLDSDADEDSGVFVVRDGETKRFTLRVTVASPSVTGDWRVTLGNVYFTEETDGVTDTEFFTPLPTTDFRTPNRTVNSN